MTGQAWALLRTQRTFRIYFLGQAISLIGAWMQQVAQAWVIVALTKENAQIAAISFTAAVPMMALSMHGGLAADKLDRRKILIVTQLGLAALAFIYAVLVGWGWLRLIHVYVLAAALGAVMAFDLPAMQALVPELVPRQSIPDAIALNQSLVHGTRLVGPALAGVLMANTSAAMAFVANGVSYFAVVYSLMVIRPPEGTPRPEQHARGGLGEGVRYIMKHRVVRAIIGFTALSTTFVFPALIIFMANYIKTGLGGDEAALGILMSCSGAGAMTGALLLLRVPADRRGIFLIASCCSAACMLFTFATVRTVAAAAPVVAFQAFSISMSMGLAATMIQVVVPSELRGRVMAVYGMMWTGILPIAALILGKIADVVGLRTAMHFMAVIYVVLTVPWLLRAGLAKRVAHGPAQAEAA